MAWHYFKQSMVRHIILLDSWAVKLNKKVAFKQVTYIDTEAFVFSEQRLLTMDILVNN